MERLQHDHKGDDVSGRWNAGVCDCGVGTTDSTGMTPLSTRQRAARALAGAMMFAALPRLRALPAPLRRPARAVLGWFGAAHLVAAVTNYPGCPELGAIPSLVLRRQIQTPCGPWERIDSVLGLRSSAPTRTIGAQRLAELMRESDDVRLLDVLPAEHFANVHIPQAENFPLASLRAQAPGLLHRDDAVVVYCADDSCPDSAEAARALAGLGYEDVYEFEGGIAEWRRNGLPLVRNSVGSDISQ